MRVNVFETVFNHILPFMTVDVNTFAMADWFEAKIMQPVNGSVHRNPPS